MVFVMSIGKRSIGEPNEMAKPLKENEIMENLTLLADWLRVRNPGERFDEIHHGAAKKSKRQR
jgi:hypothetical protein